MAAEEDRLSPFPFIPFSVLLITLLLLLLISLLQKVKILSKEETSFQLEPHVVVVISRGHIRYLPTMAKWRSEGHRQIF